MDKTRNPLSLLMIAAVLLLLSCGSSKYYECRLFEYTPPPEDTSKINFSHTLALCGDTIDLCLTNDGDRTAFLFDSYLEDYEIHLGILDSPAAYRYNAEDSVFKMSFLPLLPGLRWYPWDLVVLSERRMTRGGQVDYSFRPIAVNETLCLSIPVQTLRADAWTEDADVRKFNTWDFSPNKKENVSFEKSDRHIKDTPSPSLCLELAFYNDTTGLNRDYYNHNEFDFNTRIKRFKPLRIPVPQAIIDSIYHN